MAEEVQFRARYLKLSRKTEPLGEQVDPDTLLRREAEMRRDFTAPLTLAAPMRFGAEEPDELWDGPFRTPQLLHLERLWRESDGTALLIAVATSFAQMPRLDAVSPMSSEERREVVGKMDSPELYARVGRNVMTEDGHVWFASSMSRTTVGSGLICVLFPYTRLDEQGLMRPMLMFTQGTVTDADCAHVVAHLVLGFEMDASSERRRVA